MGFFRLCHASLNSRACLVFAKLRIFVFVQLNLWSLLLTWLAGSDRGYFRLIAFLCSVIRDLTVFDVFPMYTWSQSWHAIMHTTLRFSNFFYLVIMFSEIRFKFICVLMCYFQIVFFYNS